MAVDGLNVHAIEWTPAEPSDVRILLVHGLGANALSWEPIGQALADRFAATVTALDLVGFGRTRAPERPATIAANRDLVNALLDQLGPSVIIGNSMGGAIGIAATARRLDLVEGLVLVNPAIPHPSPTFGDWARAAKFSPVMVQPLGRSILGTRARLIGPERLVDTSLAWSLHDPTRLDPALRLRLIALASERFAYPEAAGAYIEAARSLFLYQARDLHNDLATASASRPVLLVHGVLDRLVPLAAAQSAADRHPGIDLQLLGGIGHAPQLEDPDRLVEVVTGWLGARMSAWPRPDRPQVSSTSRSRSSSPS